MNAAAASSAVAQRAAALRAGGQRFSAPALGLVVLAHGGVLLALLSMGVLSLPTPPAALMVSLVQAEVQAPAPAMPPPKPQALQRSAQPAPPATRPQPSPAAPLLASASAQAESTLELAKADKPLAQPVTSATSTANANTAVSATANSAAQTTAAPAAPAPSAPRFDADYLQNPAPAYPPLSRRAGEEGRVVLHVFVEPGGQAGKVELRSSSGFERLDRAAIAAVSRWKFVPAKQGTDAVGAWVLVPLVFSLKI